MKKNILNFLRQNFIVFIFLAVFIAIELYSITLTGCKPFLTNPLYFFIVLMISLSLMFLIDNKYIKIIISAIILFLQGILNVLLVFLYDSNGTYFTWEMIKQREDALATVEELSLNLNLIITFIVLFIFFCFCSLFYTQFIYKKEKSEQMKTKQKKTKISKIVFGCLFSLCLIFTIFIPSIDGYVYSKNSYVKNILYGSEVNPYQQKGMCANAVYEFFNGTIATNLRKYNDDGIEEYLQEGGELETSKYNGISKDNNLIYILVESFEWFSFVDLLPRDKSLELFPNLNNFMANGLFANNYYSREKTDTSEMLAILGSSCFKKSVNYYFEENAYPYSLPNLFKEGVQRQDNNLVHVKSFHQNNADFYNRIETHDALGFEDYITIEDMVDMGIENTLESMGEPTLDSITMETIKDEMMPETNENEQYMSFWITYSMHGDYNYRKTFEEHGYYQKLDDCGVFPASDLNKLDNQLRTYIAAVLDFDKAVGIMMDRLEENGDLENTTIVMFADHNAYYNNLSSYAKGIKERYNSKLYRVPFMIYDQKLTEEYIKDNGSNIISKFACGEDLLPTILDIFGIKGYKNLYLGVSMFVENKESVIYSYAYGIFVNDKLICYSIKKLLYKCEGFTNEDKEKFIENASILLKKQEKFDIIFHTNYFKTHDYVSFN